MISKKILGFSFVAVFAIVMIVPAYASGHLTISDYMVENNGNGKSQSVHIELGGPIPVLPAGNFGWAVPTSNGGFLVIASHPVAVDSTAQPPDEELHTHFLRADTSSDDCNSGIHVTFATKNEVGRLSISDDSETIWVKNVPRGLAGDLQSTGAFGFNLSFENLNGDSTVSLCVNPV